MPKKLKKVKSKKNKQRFPSPAQPAYVEILSTVGTKRVKNPAATKLNRGFRAMNKRQQAAIASLGGKTVSKSSKHMAEIGRIGGLASGKAKRLAKAA